MALKGAIIYNVNIDSMENQEENVMKILKVLSASAIAAAVAAAVTVPASAATTYKDVIEATKACGVQAHNVQQLENFLEANDSYFTSDEYDEMVADMENIRDTYVIPAAKKAGLPTDDLAALSEDDKILIERVFDYAHAGEIAVIRKYGQLLEEEYRENGIYVRARVSREVYARISF